MRGGMGKQTPKSNRERENMDTKTAARNWGLSVRSVQDYCKNGIIPGITQNALKQYVIPEDAKKPYFPRVYVNRTASDDRYDILNALYLDTELTPKRLNISLQRFTDMLATLSDAGLVALRSPQDDPEALASYRLANRGIDVMEAQDPKRLLAGVLRKWLAESDA